MKKTAYIFTALFTFFLSLSIYFVFLNFEVDKSKLMVEPLESTSLPLGSLCEIMSNPDLYKIDDFRIKANIFRAEEGVKLVAFKFDHGCDFEFVEVEIWTDNNRIFSSEETSEKIHQLLKQLKIHDFGQLETDYTEVEIIGFLGDRPQWHCWGCASPQNFIKAKDIKQTSPIKRISFLRKFNDKRFPHYFGF
jgi:hypothetical protein